MQDLRCKNYANSGLRAQSLTPPNATELRQPEEVADPFKSGGLCDDDLEDVRPVIVESKGPQYQLVQVREKFEGTQLGKRKVSRSDFTWSCGSCFLN